MSAAGDARRARLGEAACRRAQQIADEAPELTPEMVAILAPLLHVPTKAKRPQRAA